MLTYLKDKIPFELKRGSSVLSVLLALIITGLLMRLGGLILETVVSTMKPYLPRAWNLILILTTISFEINLLGIIIFIIILFPIYRMMDKLFLSKIRGEIVFSDKFNAGNKGWLFNFWNGNNPNEKNRIENSAMIFKAQDVDLLDPKKEYGAYFDLRSGIYKGNKYEVICKVRAEHNTTMQFRLWLHDTKGGDSNIATPFATPSSKPEKIKLEFTATESEAIRIHLHCKSGTGEIIVSEVLVRKL